MANQCAIKWLFEKFGERKFGRGEFLLNYKSSTYYICSIHKDHFSVIGSVVSSKDYFTASDLSFKRTVLGPRMRIRLREIRGS